jgi:hypothetical protein
MAKREVTEKMKRKLSQKVKLKVVPTRRLWTTSAIEW